MTLEPVSGQALLTSGHFVAREAHSTAFSSDAFHRWEMLMSKSCPDFGEQPEADATRIRESRGELQHCCNFLLVYVFYVYVYVSRE